ncbi:MAG: hypothetical protein A2176_00740 [Spirochaetes bacterium RBG_13_51_14]|nr:MAG: hypothetical protein A2176_00740 [Spirochaetes bacterium RBG_13_51_14]
MRRLTREVIPESGVSGIVVYGVGRHFSSGADLDDLTDAIRNANRTVDRNGATIDSTMLMDNLRSFIFFEELNVPVIAAVRGVCLGSGLELALFCHGRICGQGAVLGLPEATFGLIPGCGGIQKIISAAGMARTMELVLTGASFTSEDALRWNIVDKIVPKKDVVETAINYIKELNKRRGGL